MSKYEQNLNVRRWWFDIRKLDINESR